MGIILRTIGGFKKNIWKEQLIRKFKSTINLSLQLIAVCPYFYMTGMIISLYIYAKATDIRIHARIDYE